MRSSPLREGYFPHPTALALAPAPGIVGAVSLPRDNQASQPHDVLPGTVVQGKYELVEIAGIGGMATVWRAAQRGLGRFQRTVAIKHMHPHLATQADFRAMFFEEARVGAELVDPNIAHVQDFFEENQQLYLVMEWVEGIDLATYNRYVVATAQQTRWELITAVGIGLLHGLAGSSHFFGVLPMLALPNRAMAVGYLLTFSLGTIAAMAAFSAIVGLTAKRFQHRTNFRGFDGCS